MCACMAEIKAIDMHVHLHDALAIAAKGERSAQMARYMKRKDDHAVSVDELADQYRARQMMAVLVNTTDILVRIANLRPEDARRMNRIFYIPESDPKLLQPVVDATAKYSNFPSFASRDLIFVP